VGLEVLEEMEVEVEVHVEMHFKEVLVVMVVEELDLVEEEEGVEVVEEEEEEEAFEEVIEEEEEDILDLLEMTTSEVRGAIKELFLEVVAATVHQEDTNPEIIPIELSPQRRSMFQTSHFQ